MSERNAPPTSRLARYVVSRGWLHLVLLTGVAVFLLPFLWMVATSMKADEELTSQDWLPSLPRFVGASPYVLPAPKLEKPLPVDPKEWDRAVPALASETRAAIERYLQAHPEEDVDQSTHVNAAAAVLLNRLAARINAKLWNDPAEAYRALLDEETIAAAMDDRLARLELRGLGIQTADGELLQLCDSKSAADFWQVKSGPGKIVRDRSGATYVKYDFASARSDPVVLTCVIPPTVAPVKFVVSIKPDNSWHRVDAEVSAAQVWRSTHTNYLAQNRPTSIIFQFPSYEDQMLKPRTWTPLGQVDATPAAPGTSLTLTISPSSTPGAIYGKVQANYARAFRSVPFWSYLGNSLLLVVLITLGTLFSSMFVAYAFARLRWPGRAVAFVVLLSTMMLPAQVTMIPSFVIWRQLGWYNTLNPLWVPAFFGGAFFIFLMTQHMKTIPRELEEAARIDGLNALQTWWYVFVPLAKPAAAAVAIMTVMAAWNEFMGPLIYLRDQTRFPLSLGLFAVQLDADNDWTMIMAGNVIMALPMIGMFVVFQRYFIQGMMMGGVKG